MNISKAGKLCNTPDHGDGGMSGDKTATSRYIGAMLSGLGAGTWNSAVTVPHSPVLLAAANYAYFSAIRKYPKGKAPVV